MQTCTVEIDISLVGDYTLFALIVLAFLQVDVEK